MSTLKRVVGTVILGSAFSVLIKWARYSLEVALISPADPQTIPTWYAYATPLLYALIAVLPGLIAGWFAGRSGFFVGAAVGILSSLIWSMTFSQVWTHAYEYYWAVLHAVSTQLVLNLHDAVISAVSGGAGEYLRLLYRSSSSFNQGASPDSVKLHGEKS